jgi:hypothetical protein
MRTLATPHAPRGSGRESALSRILGSLALLPALACVLVVSTGCESTDGGGSSVSGGVYYGVGVYDPWYYGGYYDDVDVIVTPPGRPDAPVHPEHPIARPPAASSPRPTPMPSIPSTPRAAPRGGGRR